MIMSSSIFEFELEKFKEVRVFLYQGDSSLLPSLIAMDADYSFKVKNIEIWVPAFFKHNNLSVATVLRLFS